MNQLSGPRAEDAVVAYLERHRYEIVARNWRTRFCEVDIIAHLQDCLYFVEVKYRRTNLQGDGFAYITAKKLWRMERAARSWVASHAWNGAYNLSAAAVSGDTYEVSFIASIVS